MEIRILMHLLHRCEALIQSAGKGPFEQELVQFRQVFVGHEEKTVAKFTSAALKHIESREKMGGGISPHSSMGQIQNYLKQLQALFIELKKKPAADDMRRIIELIAACNQPSLGGFLNKVRDALEKAAQKPVKKASRAAPLREDLARAYADKLTKVSENNQAFDTLIKEVKADRKLRIQEMRKIAEFYLGHETAGKTKAAALNAIIQRQALDAAYQAKSDAMGKMKSW